MTDPYPDALTLIDQLRADLKFQHELGRLSEARHNAMVDDRDRLRAQVAELRAERDALAELVEDLVIALGGYDSAGDDRLIDRAKTLLPHRFLNP